MCAAGGLYLVAALSSILFANFATAAEFPEGIPRCHVGDTECIARVATQLVQKYAHSGYPEAGFPVVEPFFLKRFDISDGQSGSLSLKLNFRDVNVEGLSGLTFDRAVGFDKDAATSKFEMYGSVPQIIFRGKYTTDGRILFVPLKGDGDANVIVKRPKFSAKFKPTVQERNGKTYVKVDKLKVLLEPEGLDINLTKLFSSDPTLGENLNQFLNENWHDVWLELQPAVNLAVAEIMKLIFTSIFEKYSYDDIYLPS